MSRRTAAVLTAALALAGMTSLAGCGSSGGTAQPAPAASSVAYAAIIDVRTPAEFAQGHVVGARNIDVESAGFAAEIAALPTSGTYLVYCRSGNRSAQAATKMRAAGLDVIDGGAMTDMVDAGWPKA